MTRSDPRTRGRIGGVFVNGVLLAGLLGGLLSSTARAQDLEAIFQRGNAAYFQGDYAGAVRDYGLLVEAGVEDPDVSFNLATAHGRMGNYGHAIRWYERALRLRPGDEGAADGLRLTTDAIGQRHAEAAGEATLETEPPLGESLVRPLSQNGLAWLVLALDVLFFGLFIAIRFVRAEAGRLGLGIAIPIVGAVFLLSAMGLALKTGILVEGRPAVIVAREPMLREGPDPRAVSRQPVHEGERARILDRDGTWVRVKVGGGREGWMEAGEVGAI
jgi:hypothetical protein